MPPKMNRPLLDNWVKHGLALQDLGDGAWGWTEKGKQEVLPAVRHLLSDLLWLNDISIPSYLHSFVREAGFDPITGKTLT